MEIQISQTSMMVHQSKRSCHCQRALEYWFPVILEVKHNFSTMDTAYIMSFFGISQAFGRLVLGLFLLRRIPSTFYILVASALFSLGFLAFLWVSHYHAFFIIIVMIGLASSCLLPVIMSYASSLTKSYQTQAMLDNSVLLTRDGFWHTIFFTAQGEACVFDAELNYHLYLDLPAVGTICKGVKNPFD